MNGVRVPGSSALLEEVIRFYQSFAPEQKICCMKAILYKTGLVASFIQWGKFIRHFSREKICNRLRSFIVEQAREAQLPRGGRFTCLSGVRALPIGVQDIGEFFPQPQSRQFRTCPPQIQAEKHHFY
jgi:hypothetical protein